MPCGLQTSAHLTATPASVWLSDSDPSLRVRMAQGFWQRLPEDQCHAVPGHPVTPRSPGASSAGSSSMGTADRGPISGPGGSSTQRSPGKQPASGHWPWPGLCHVTADLE